MKRKNIKLINVSACIEHPDRAVAEWHHVVPVIFGGTMTVPLCESCHNKIHGKSENHYSHSELIKQGIEKARVEGKQIGRPKQIENLESIIPLSEKNMSHRAIAKLAGCSPSTVCRFLKHREKGVA